MTEAVTVARPYAIALFESAKAKGTLNEWSSRLAFLVIVARDKRAVSLLKDATLSSEMKVNFLIDLDVALLKEARSFLESLTVFNRLLLLPEIAMLFEQMKAELERTIHVRVLASHTMNEEQQQKLVSALKVRLQKEVALTVEIDPSIIGGVVIQAEDMIIDHSIKGRLQELAKALTA